MLSIQRGITIRPRGKVYSRGWNVKNAVGFERSSRNTGPSIRSDRQSEEQGFYQEAKIFRCKGYGCSDATAQTKKIKREWSLNS